MIVLQKVHFALRRPSETEKQEFHGAGRDAEKERREGYAVYTGRIKGREIDFVAEKNTIRKYVQVAYLMPDEHVAAREFGNLATIDDNYEKLVVTMDDVSFGNHNGISHVKAWDFMGRAEVALETS